MSDQLNTDQYRNLYANQGSRTVDVRNLCDEIDRLRKELLKSNNRKQTQAAELYILREQARWPAPRSIKDNPPPLNSEVLAWNGTRWMDFQYTKESLNWTEWTHWLPMPPPPPKPDAFIEWAKSQPWWDALGELAQAYMRDCWDAAMKSHEKD